MHEIPVVTRTQRRFERRQMFVMIILVMAVTVASFFLGVMVGERGLFAGGKAETPRLPMAQIAPPPLPASAAPAGAQKLTFYDDLPKGNSAPLGSGINLPKGGYVPPPPAAAATPVAAPQSPAAVPAPAPVREPAPAPPPTPEKAAPKAVATGAYIVQVAATRDQAEARRMVDKLNGKGYVAASERADLGAKGIWYRVTVGPYGDKAAADAAAAQLKQEKFAAIVRKK